MRRIIYIPVDERPCNYEYVQNNFGNIEGIELLMPEKDILGYKKVPANIDRLFEFIESNVSEETTLAFSADMLIYGGLCPSRIHNHNETDLIGKVQRIKELKTKFPNLVIYAFSSIMRNPKYSSNDEEPDYYEHFGEQIHRRAYLQSKQNYVSLNSDEMNELDNIQIPKIVLNDYEGRRNKNRNINIKLIELINEGIINILVFPQDDSSEYGYTVEDQRKIYSALGEDKNPNVHSYPGLDELGLELVSKSINREKEIKVSYSYSYEESKTLIPNYEDKEMEITMNKHLSLLGGEVIDSNDAEFHIYVNSPNKETAESWDNTSNDGSVKESHLKMVERIRQSLSDGKKVIIVDAAYTNGSDKAFINLLDKNDLLLKLESYMGWNTHANSLGSALATGFTKRTDKVKKDNILYHVIEDYLYQSIIRHDITNNHLQHFPETNYFTLKNYSHRVKSLEETKILELLKEMNIYKSIGTLELSIWHPWNRMFEIGIKIGENIWMH